jgi:hypothetical protein
LLCCRWCCEERWWTSALAFAAVVLAFPTACKVDGCLIAFVHQVILRATFMAFHDFAIFTSRIAFPAETFA